MKSQKYPSIRWDFGAAYDLFVSLHVLHDPAGFGLRPSWAAGVRSRLSNEERKTLEEIPEIIGIPFHWIYSLPNQKDAASTLWALRQLPSEERLPALTCIPGRDSDLIRKLRDVAEKKTWHKEDVDFVKAKLLDEEHGRKKSKNTEKILETWANSGEFGERILKSLDSYYESFFAEEERHIYAALKDAYLEAQDKAEKLSFPELFENLSQGVKVSDMFSSPEIVLIPSYWSTPLIFFGNINENCKAVLFGARPDDVSLVPGEVVPDSLLRVLKAIADPTRLRILRYLSQEELNQAELARRLRLRAPTLTHHLRSLRLAGLVFLKVESFKDQRYAARLEAIRAMFSSLENFLIYDLEENHKK
jgi:DNA-binding transcriptional ArsR family regulator